jgi:hypothetical protein
MPEVFINLNIDLINIDIADKLLNKVKETKSIYEINHNYFLPGISIIFFSLI